MPLYEIWESIDGTEVSLTPADARDKLLTTTDTNGRPMKCVKRFSAADGNEAAQVRNDHYGWGPYEPWP